MFLTTFIINKHFRFYLKIYTINIPYTQTIKIIFLRERLHDLNLPATERKQQ